MSPSNAVAFGLQLSSSFALPGTRALRVPGLPELQLRLGTPEDLRRRWHDGCGRTEWAGLQGDGRELRIELGANGARLFSYGEKARFHLDSEMRLLTCVPESSGLEWQRALLGKVVPAISVMRGYEALHAAAVKAPQGAVAIAAPSGTGKSTLALALLERGWPLVADDVLALSPAPSGALAHPGMAQMNLAGGGDSGLPDGLRTIGVLDGERWVAVDRAATTVSPLAAVILFERGAERNLVVERLGRSLVPLAPYMLGVAADSRRRSERFALFAELASATPMFRLRAGAQCPPAALADELQSALCAPGASR